MELCSSPKKHFPEVSNLSQTTLIYIRQNLKQPQDFSGISSLVSNLNSECTKLNEDLNQLICELSIVASDWISLSTTSRNIISQTLSHDKFRETSCDKICMLDEELHLFEKEVGQVETIRLYAETALKLEALVGDLEDATFATLNRTSGSNSFNFSNDLNLSERSNRQETVSLATKTLIQIEEILAGIVRNRPNWTRLLIAVDSRVEKTMSILRPKLLSDHRILLASLGWPPNLSTSNFKNNRSQEIPNPLVSMRGEKKEKYTQSFLELCALQHVHMQRASREAGSININQQFFFKNDLWSIDELVNPIVSRMEHHFSKWSNVPKFIFALVYKITRDFVDDMDNVLQPLIDEALLVGCSARETWVSGMVKALSKYLEIHFFPRLAKKYDFRVENIDVDSSWIHIVDLMIDYDTKMNSLSNLGTSSVLSQSQALLSMFDQHFDWLQIWADIELKDALQKLDIELNAEKNWLLGSNQEGNEAEKHLLSTREDYKAPLIVDFVLTITRGMIERSRSLPSKSSKALFVSSTAISFLNHFSVFLLQRSHDMDFTTSILEDNDLITVAGCLNTARYMVSTLQEWNEEFNILEASSSLFKNEILFLIKLDTDCLMEIVSALLLQFDALSIEYIYDKKQWSKEQADCENQYISLNLIAALEMLRTRLELLRYNLNPVDFFDVWRSTAEGLDHFIFNSIPLNDVEFSWVGVHQYRTDMSILFNVFKPCCKRPEAFFPCLNETLKLLAMEEKNTGFLLNAILESKSSSEIMKTNGLFHISLTQARKILRNIKF